MGEKKPLRYPTRDRFTMLPAMEPNYVYPGSENWPVADRSAEDAAARPPVPGWVMAGEPVPPAPPADGG